MKNKNAFFRNASAFGIVIGLWVLYSLMATDLLTMVDGLTAVVFITVVTLLASDAMEKAFTDPTLFCRLEGDSLEGVLLTDQPFVSGYGTYNSVAHSSTLSAQEKSAALTNIATYINTLIARRNRDTASA